MFISPNGYGGVRKRIGHFRGGRFDLCCSHCGEWQWRGNEKGEGENNKSVLLVCIWDEYLTSLNAMKNFGRLDTQRHSVSGRVTSNIESL